MNGIESEVLQAENALLGYLRNAEVLKGVSMHLNSPGYRNIWNGEVKTYDDLRSRIATAIDNGLASIDYQVASRDISILDSSKVLVTLEATETTHMKNGDSKTSAITVISILWRKIDGKWWVGYLHASEEPIHQRAA